MTIDDIRVALRRALGDQAERFKDSFPGGEDVYELSRARIADFEVDLITDGDVSPAPPDSYTLDAMEGVLAFHEPVPSGTTVLVTGTAYALFDDAELDDYINRAVTRHTHEREKVTRYRDEKGHIRYKREPITLDNLPEIEREPLIVLATIEALWDLATDAASDADVWTAEGTHLPRGQRYEQLTHQISLLTERYQEFCRQLNIGLERGEVGTLRRVSKTTGRLVPVFREREYDESGPDSYPKRLLPPIDSPHEDESGLPSPIWGPY